MTEQPKIISDGQFAAVQARYISHGSLMWQVPALNIATQAFLYSVIFGEKTPIEGRLIAAFLGVFAAFAGLHLLAKHRAMELYDAKLLADYEAAKDWLVVHGRRHHDVKPRIWKWFINRSAFHIWLWTSFAFLAGAVVALGMQLVALWVLYV